MGLVGDIRMYGRFALGLRGFLGRRVTIDQARAVITRRLAERETAFLRVVERGVFGFPRSPYRPLLAQAGCELGDLRAMVRARGLEPTLRALLDSGVYFTFEEFKGRRPVVRDGREIRVSASDFDNPYVSRTYHAETGGSTGAGTRVSTDLDSLLDTTPGVLLAAHAHGVEAVPTIVWRGILPDGSGIGFILRNTLFGNTPREWFVPFLGDGLRTSLKHRAATHVIIAAARLSGAAVPSPRTLALDEAVTVARRAAAFARESGACFVGTSVSMSVRVCIAAREEGIDLCGVVFSAGSEPMTPAKLEAITAAGARAMTNYYFNEIGPVGMGCACPADCNDQHLLRDSVALVQSPRAVPGAAGLTVESFHFTTLLASAPKIMLNVEIDDYGRVETRECGCPLGEIGLTTHLREIRSFAKLTGEGVTLVGSEMIDILERVLPERFGGGPQDFQLVEEEDESGLTRLSLLVSPRIELNSENDVVGTVLGALKRGGGGADLAQALWQQAGTLRIKRVEPNWTGRGKLLPLHLGRPRVGSA